VDRGGPRGNDRRRRLAGGREGGLAPWGAWGLRATSGCSRRRTATTGEPGGHRLGMQQGHFWEEQQQEDKPSWQRALEEQRRRRLERQAQKASMWGGSSLAELAEEQGLNASAGQRSSASSLLRRPSPRPPRPPPRPPPPRPPGRTPSWAPLWASSASGAAEGAGWEARGKGPCAGAASPAPHCCHLLRNHALFAHCRRHWQRAGGRRGCGCRGRGRAALPALATGARVLPATLRLLPRPPRAPPPLGAAS